MVGAKERPTMEILFAVYYCMDRCVIPGDFFSYQTFYNFVGNRWPQFNISAYWGFCYYRFSFHAFHLYFKRKKI